MKLALHTKIIIGLLLGVGWALLSSHLGWNQLTADWISPFGDIFIRLLKLIAIPLVLFSIIGGVAGLSDVHRLGRTGVKALLFYLGTTITAVTVGLLLVNLIQPGSFLPDADITRNRLHYELWAQDSGIAVHDDLRLSEAPEHQAQVAEIRASQAQDGAEAARQARLAELARTAEASKKQSPLQPLVDMVPENIILSLGDSRLMLQVIFFALFFGITLLTLPRARTQVLVDLVSGINDIFIKMVELVMRAAPFFVFCLMAGVMAKMASTPAEVLSIFRTLGWYALTVVSGLGIVVLLIYPTLIAVLVKNVSYRDFLRAMSPAQFLAFSTSSSAATLPVTIKCVEERLGVSRKISSFTLPIGATVNMDGTSLYQAVAVVFLAQMHGVDLSLAQQIQIVLTATLASIGAAAVPSAGLVMLMLVLTSVGLNPAWIAIIFPIDRILDMCRTVVNVTGDATVCTMVATMEGEIAPPTAEDA